MFNRDFPYNDLPFLPSDINYDSVKILKALAGAKGAIGRLDVFTKLLPDREMFLTHFAIKESVESSLIENVETSVETIYEASRIEEKYMSKNQKEVMYYSEALILGLNLVRKQGFLAQNDYEKIGGILSPVNGHIRTGGHVNIKKDGEHVIYTPPAGRDNIERLLGNYEKYFNNMIDHDIDSLIKMALIHYQFEAIHPFYDGNGRTGRILMVLHLVLNQNLEYPIIYLSGYINKNRTKYYELLKNVTENLAWDDFIVFMLNCIEYQAKETISDIEKIRDLRSQFVKILENDGVIKKIFAEPIASLLISKPKLLREDLGEFGSKNTLTAYIKRLIELGLLKESGTVGKNKIYTNVKFIELTK